MPDDLQGIEKRYGMPLYSVHRVNLHSQLRLLAMEWHGEGDPVDVRVIGQVKGEVALEDNRVMHAEILVPADGVHSATVGHILGKDAEVQATNTGWSCMRWLVATEELRADPDTKDMVKKSVQRYFMGVPAKGALVWYPCSREYVIVTFLVLVWRGS